MYSRGKSVMKTSRTRIYSRKQLPLRHPANSMDQSRTSGHSPYPSSQAAPVDRTKCGKDVHVATVVNISRGSNTIEALSKA